MWKYEVVVAELNSYSIESQLVWVKREIDAGGFTVSENGALVFWQYNAGSSTMSFSHGCWVSVQRLGSSEEEV